MRRARPRTTPDDGRAGRIKWWSNVQDGMTMQVRVIDGNECQDPDPGSWLTPDGGESRNDRKEAQSARKAKTARRGVEPGP